MKYTNSLVYMSLAFIMSISGLNACSNSEDVSENQNQNQSDLKSDDFFEGTWADETEEVEESREDNNSWEDPSSVAEVKTSFSGDGYRGGYELISAYIPLGCNAYKIDDRAFVTTALCLAECLYSGSEIAVISTITPGRDINYLGLVEKIAVSSTHSSDFENGIGIIYLDRPSESKARPLIDQRVGPVKVLGIDREIKYVEGTRGYLQATEDECKSDSVAITDENMGLIGLSLGRRGQCDEFLFLPAFTDFLDEALRDGFTPIVPQYEATEEERQAEEEAAREERQAEEDERRWAEEEAAALSRAPACDMQGETYCDGNIEMYCQGTTYKALHCGRVGWTCRDNSTWGPSCEP